MFKYMQSDEVPWAGAIRRMVLRVNLLEWVLCRYANDFWGV